MSTYIVRRIVQTIPVMLGASILVFLMMRMVPGDPALFLVGPESSPEALEAVRDRLGLNEPLPVQYWLWLVNALQGNFGISVMSGVDVWDLIVQRLPASIELAVGGMVVTLVLAFVLGIISGIKPGSPIDLAASTFNGVFLAVPLFFVGILFIIYFSLVLGWFPPGGRPGFEAGVLNELRSLAMPAVVLGIAHAPIIARFLRNGILDTSREDYVRTARSKGMPESVVVRRHILRNSLLPVLTVSGIVFGSLLGGVVITERVFAWPGLGTLLLTAIEQRDFAVVQAVMLLAVAIFVVVNLIVDIMYGYVDPRIRSLRRA